MEKIFILMKVREVNQIYSSQISSILLSCEALGSCTQGARK